MLNDNGPKGFVMVLHPAGRRILGDANIAFSHGPKHKALRASFLPLFGRKALGMYLHMQVRTGGRGGLYMRRGDMVGELVARRVTTLMRVFAACSPSARLQEDIIRTHLDKWLRQTTGTTVEVRELCRVLNQEVRMDL